MRRRLLDMNSLEIQHFFNYRNASERQRILNLPLEKWQQFCKTSISYERSIFFQLNPSEQDQVLEFFYRKITGLSYLGREASEVKKILQAGVKKLHQFRDD